MKLTTLAAVIVAMYFIYQLRVLQQRPPPPELDCRCEAFGDTDNLDNFDISLGSIKASAAQSEQLVLAPRAACGPIRVRASVASPALP